MHVNNCFTIPHYRYQGQEGFAPAAFLQRYHGAVINTEVTTGAQVVSTINDAISSNGAKSASWKPAESARVPTPKSSTWKNSEPTSPKLDESASWKPPEASRVPSPKLPTKPKPFESTSKPFDAPRLTSPTSPKNPEPAAVTSPKPVSPKLEVQKFAPTWHSVQHHHIDKEREYHHTQLVLAPL